MALDAQAGNQWETAAWILARSLFAWTMRCATLILVPALATKKPDMCPTLRNASKRPVRGYDAITTKHVLTAAVAALKALYSAALQGKVVSQVGGLIFFYILFI